MKPFFTGVATAMITPFNKNGVNFEAFGDMIEYQIAGGVDALVILGTTGEPATMTEEEKNAIIEYSIKKTNKRVKTIIGTGSNCTKKAIKDSIAAEKMGADGLLVVTPYYNKCTQNGIYEYYKAISEVVNIPIICYNVPPRTGVNILPATMEKIAALKNIGGIKEACGNMEQICETARRIRNKTCLFSGDDNLNLPILAIGGCGLISVASNIVPKEIKQLYTYLTELKLNKAIELNDKLLPLIDSMFYEVNPIPCKAAANMIGLNGGIPRPPLTELEEPNKIKLREVLTNFGLKIN